MQTPLNQSPLSVSPSPSPTPQKAHPGPTTSSKTNPSPYETFSLLKDSTLPNRMPINTLVNDDVNVKALTNLTKKLNFNAEVAGDCRTSCRESQRRGLDVSGVGKENLWGREVRDSSYCHIARTDELELIHTEHRLEVEKLLLQISRLHDIIYQLQKSKKQELSKQKQQYEQQTYLHLTNLKQAHTSQIQILQAQLKKTKQILEIRSTEYTQLYKSASKDKQLQLGEIEMLRASVKELVNRKNQELFQIREESQEIIGELRRKNLQEIQGVKELCDKQVTKIAKDMQIKNQQLTKLEQEFQSVFRKNQQLQEHLDKQRILLEEKLRDYMDQSSNKYQSLIDHVNEVMNQQQACHSDRQKQLKQFYQLQISTLLKLSTLKTAQLTRVTSQLNSHQSELQSLQASTTNRLTTLRTHLQEEQTKHLQQLQLVKIKMAVLHQNDIKQLVRLYETKLDNLNQELCRDREENQRIRIFMHQELERAYSIKKMYQDTVSRQNVEILRLRSGMGTIEKEMKDRLENQRSAMLLTSKSLIRGVELKNTNVKFNEEELRKLRITIDKLQKDAETNEKALKEEISSLHDEISRLIELNRENEAENRKMQEQYLQTIEQKEGEIKRLNQVARKLIEQNNQCQSEQITQLTQQLEALQKTLQQQIQTQKQLWHKIQKLQKDLQQSEIQNQQLYLQNQIAHEQSRTEYKKIAETNTISLKQFYQNKIRELESDKNQIKKQRDLHRNTIDQLIRKYQIMEQCMNRVVQQGRKRGVLEDKILGLGADLNLVKNVAELWK